MILAGCHHLPPPTGESSVEFLRPSRSQGPKPDDQSVPIGSEPREIFSPATPLGELVLPIYPHEALVAHVGRTKVILQITIGIDGRVTQASAALGSVPFLGPFSGQFEEAAKAAVAQWRFVPAERRHLEAHDVNGTKFWELARTERMEMNTEVAFTFTEAGKVEAAAK